MPKARTARRTVTPLALSCGLAAAWLAVHGCADDPGVLKSDTGGSGAAGDAASSEAANGPGDAPASASDAPVDAPEAGPRADAGIDPSLVAFWRFEDAPAAYTAIDSSGHLVPAPLAGDALLVPGKVGNALHVDGDGWLNVGPLVASADAGADAASDAGAIAEWTIAFFVRVDVDDMGRAVFDMNFDQALDAAPMGLGPRLVEDGAGMYVEIGSGAGLVKATLTSAADPGAWHHVAVSWRAGSITTYYDGVQAVSTSDPSPPARFDQVQLGRGVDDTEATRFRGSLDEVRIYARALAASEIAELAK
jgi:hypothetical protein